MKKHRWIAAALVSASLFVVLAYFAGWLLTPVHTEFGSTWDAYLKEPENSVDVLFFGSSLTYCDVVPGVIWDEAAVTSYVMAGGEQTIPLTYRYIKEACRTQSPKLIAMEITGLFYAEYQHYTKLNVSYMPWSVNRIEAVFCASEPELRAGLLFPLFDYHSLWRNASPSALLQRLTPDVDLLAGYTFLSTISPQEEYLEADFSAETAQYAKNLALLHEIVAYCREENIQLLLFLSPTYRCIPEAAVAQLTADVTAIEGVIFKNFHEDWAEIGIDNSNDWYDTAHFNCYGAEKFSRYLSGYLTETFSLEPTGDADIDLWDRRVEAFENRKRQALEAES